ncbi:Hypothetical_protein [Hexamita inflata]|uniref:Hypothetical_protein n=1 Tax=Hexamita inflata TaxID=28002 RepID=A0AA86VS18_9EUKA|nr:Hypothetical protein HINF_LOCUS62868 [Hexamita inflata]
MSDLQKSTIVNTIAKLFYIPQQTNLEYNVALQVMLLPDQLFERLFVQLSLEFNVSSAELTKIFFDKIIMKNLMLPSSYLKVELKGANSHQFKQTTRTQSVQSLDFQNKFAAALREALTPSKEEFLDNSQLCKAVNQHILLNGQVDFWKKVGIIVTQKNERQLREYYQKSFLRFMYHECISGQDKVLLCQFIDQMNGQKPSLIVDRFFEVVGTTKYFKRNVIMYVVNRKQK